MVYLQVSGVAILGIGIWMKVELYMYMELTDVYYAEGPYIMIGIGIGIIVIGALGCCCTVKGKPVLLYMVSIADTALYGLIVLCVGTLVYY